MALETADELYLGTDLTRTFTIKNAAQTACVNITGWALSWMVKRYKGDADVAAILTKTTVSGIVISGVFNADPAINTQVATLTLADTDTHLLTPDLYHYELKRTDDGFEAVLTLGAITFLQGVHR